MAQMNLSNGIRVARVDAPDMLFKATCGCYVTAGRIGGTIVLCDRHNADAVLMARDYANGEVA